MFVFFTGLYASIPDATGLQNAIRNKWQAYVGRPIQFYRYDQVDEAVLFVKQRLQPGERLVGGGFSWGGDAAVRAAAKLAAVDVSLVLIDPVPFPDPKPGFPGFDLPPNVKRAWCVYRQARKNYWSGPIRSASCEFENKKFNPRPDPNEAVEHGQYVWERAPWDKVRSFLAA